MVRVDRRGPLAWRAPVGAHRRPMVGRLALLARVGESHTCSAIQSQSGDREKARQRTAAPRAPALGILAAPSAGTMRGE
jgi:hypothetical protein